MDVVEYLARYCDEVTPAEFYRDIFPSGELEKRGEYVKGQYCGIAVSVGDDKKVKRFNVTDDLEVIDQLCKTDDFCIMSPISYAGKSRKSVNARFMYALAIDVDGIKMRDYKGEPNGMVDLFYQFDGNGPSNYLPKPSYIVASGSGLHVYYVFEKPVPMFRNIVKALEKLKRRLTWMLWTQGVTMLADNVQYESLFQGFRMPGTITKTGSRARAFMVDSGQKVTIEYLNQFVLPEYRVGDIRYKSKLTRSQAREQFPEWYERRIVRKSPRGTWTCKRDLYDWWKRKLEEKVQDGHRYWCLMTLAVYGMKCGISQEEVERDVIGYVDFLDGIGKRADNPFTLADALHALDAYDSAYITYPIHTIEERTGIRIDRNKRNGRSRTFHMKRVNALRKFSRDELGEDAYKNNGRPSVRHVVEEWRRIHPEGRKVDCIRETGLSKPTVYKWWSQS